MNFKSLVGKKVNLTSIYGIKYHNITLTEFDDIDEYVTIKWEGFQEIVFATEEIKEVILA